MKRAPLRRVNPYQNEGVYHKPSFSNSPYEKTLKKMFEAQQRVDIQPITLKFCDHCTHKIEFNHDGHSEVDALYPLATATCAACGLNICTVCSRVCEWCSQLVCYVCSTTEFESSGSVSVCPNCCNNT